MAIVFTCEKFDQHLNGWNQILLMQSISHCSCFQETTVECTKTVPKYVIMITEILLECYVLSWQANLQHWLLSRPYLNEVRIERSFYIFLLKSEVEAINHAEHVAMHEIIHSLPGQESFTVWPNTPSIDKHSADRLARTQASHTYIIVFTFIGTIRMKS